MARTFDVAAPAAARTPAGRAAACSSPPAGRSSPAPSAGLGRHAPPGPNSVMAFGTAAGVPGAGSITALPGPTVGMASTPDGNGYWVVTATGQVTAEGDATRLRITLTLAQRPDPRHRRHRRWQGLLAGGGRRRDLLLRRRPVLRLDRRP